MAIEATEDEFASIRNTYIAIAGIHGIELLVCIYFWIVAYSFYRQLKAANGVSYPFVGRL